MKLLCFDTENTGALRNKANPYDPRNKCVILCIEQFDSVTKEYIKKSIDPTNPLDIYEAQKLIDESYWIVGFNLKYDIAWGKRIGLSFEDKQLWDVQLVYFIFNGQKPRFPSLNDVLEHYGFEPKLDIVKTEYWECGLDTDQVPWDILEEYCADDTHKTLISCLKQMQKYKTLDQKFQATIRVALEDLFGLQEMEENGFLFNVDKSLEEGNRLEEHAKELRYNLSELAGVLHLDINWGSGDQISSILYGGTIIESKQEQYLFEYKDPKKAPVMKSRWVDIVHTFPRLVEPVKGSELKKKDKWSTDESTLRKLKPKGNARKIINLLLELSKIDKLTSTYFYGLPKKLEEVGWEKNYIHTNLNQCVVITGRLSSTQPNLQNQPEAVQFCFESRFK